jgi:hypothetical protein
MHEFEQGTRVMHAIYGLGSIISCNRERTTTDFVDHGAKTFVTEIVTLERTADQPRKVKAAAVPARRRGKRASTRASEPKQQRKKSQKRNVP